MTDMIDFEETNVVWGWRDDPKEGYVWDQLPLKHAIAGDTDSIMLTLNSVVGEDDSLDDIVAVADEIGNLTNEAFPDFCVRAFNTPESRKGTVKTDREVVFDKALFLTKKRYIMHVVDSEGKRVDKMKIMGVELKKSDTSKAIKQILRKLVDMILDGYDMDYVLDEVQKMRRSFEEFSAIEIAKPINVKTLKRCQDAYAMTGSMKGFPYQVRATMFWNENCGKLDKQIMPGEKVGLVYIKHPKSKYIAFPIDMTVFPDWFDEFKIDYATEWLKAKKKIENYLASLEWDAKGRRDAIKRDLFGFD
jgi:DNA polymerase elongation subunit (family B)